MSKKNTQYDGNENEFENNNNNNNNNNNINMSNSIHFPPPPRTPLNMIPDPSQCIITTEPQQLEIHSPNKLQLVVGQVAVTKSSSSDKKIETSESQFTLNNRGTSNANVGMGSTPRVSGRGKVQSEPTTPAARTIFRPSNILLVGGGGGGGGVLGACTGGPKHYSAARGGGSSSRASRQISIPKSEPLLQVPLFDLVDNTSFWKDHNVQVLIRIRPLNNTETVSQGHGRCLMQESPQTLVWLGHPETRFTFDHIACEMISQEKLFMVAGLPMVDNCMSGYNSCMFAYGQTGSGKTYTMMGEISQTDGKLSKYCGITPRIFEYLFSRITEEEENRRDERLKYSCKCSFLEIYNEQITDLLEPSSTNLQLREDLKKGVYVEHLMEHSVGTVDDVIKLLLQGAANRKMAATHMNSESSRSHSVFTCIIESRWEKDSMTHLRFGRLNLVDLAGSERQKSSGAEGDRLKEAANINKSLSTLGLVIMSLVDLAHGKHRHVPYRDSRLTFLLQDSLGGNSKTTIIANVSPSICSANETLSTLKFAQRAKLIQNNAKVNEDASGDVTALQRQIQQLKGQLSFLMKHNNHPGPLSCLVPSFQQSSLNDFPEEEDSSLARNMYDDDNIQIFWRRKLKCWEATLVGALRREKLAETAVRRLEAEIEQMCRLAQQREEDAQRTKMMLRFREEKIKRLQLYVDGLVSDDKYLTEENNTLTEEIQLLRARIDKNPELTRFALENIRLLDQLRLFQDFYEQGEREALFAEISDLRDQLLEILDRNYEQHISPSRTQSQDDDLAKELGDCRNMNSKLIREVDELRRELNKYLNINQAAFFSITDSLMKDPEEFKQTDKYSLVEALSIRCDSVDEMASDKLPEDEFVPNKIEQKTGNPLAIQSTTIQKELRDARFLIEALESEQVHLMEELQFTREENQRYMKILSEKGKVDGQFKLKFESHCIETGDLGNQKQTSVREGSKDISIMALQAKLDRMTNELEEVRLLKFKYQMDQASQLTQDHQIELVREQVEMETARTIIHLQDEVDALQSEFKDKLCYMAEENVKLRNTIAAKEDETKALSVEWERATSDLTSFLLDGSKSLKDASGHIETIASSFPTVNVWISEHVERAGKLCVEKEEMILMLKKSLEDAQKVILEMELKLDSLKGATMALTEVQQVEKDASNKASSQLNTLLNDKVNMIELLEHKLKYNDDQIVDAEKRANAAFLVVKRLTESSKAAFRNNGVEDFMSKMATSSEMGGPEISGATPNRNASLLEDIEIQVELATLGLLEIENAINASCTETYKYLFAVETEIHEASSLFRELIQGLLKDMQKMRKDLVDLQENQKDSQLQNIRTPSLLAHKFSKHENQCYMLHQVKDELAETNYKLDIVKELLRTYGCPVTAENLGDEDACSASCATSGSNLSAETIDLQDLLHGSSSSCCYERPRAFDLEGGSLFPSHDHESEKPERLLRKSIPREATLCLRKEFKMAIDTFSKLNVLLAGFFNENTIDDCSCIEGTCLPESLAFSNDGEQNISNNRVNQFKLPRMTPVLQPLEQESEAGDDKRELISRKNINQGSDFFSKFEEARATMKGADFMLNALLKANEDEKQLTSVWKRAGEELLEEKTNSIKEIKQLRSSILLKDGENALLHDEIHHSLLEIGNLMSLVEGSFLHMQRDVEQMFKILYSDASAMVQDILHSIYNTKSLLEDICSDTMEKEFTSFVLYQCHVEESLRKISSLDEDPGSPQSRLQASYLEIQNRQRSWFIGENDSVVTSGEGKEEGDQTPAVAKLEGKELVVTHENLAIENLSLKKELEWKEHILKGLLFDFSLLQESASSTKDIRDETDKLLVVLSQVRHELVMKTGQLNNILVQHRELEGRLADAEIALSSSNLDLEDAKGTLYVLSEQNTELRVLLKDLYLKKSEAEEQLEEQAEIVKSLEEEILRLTSCADTEKKLLSSIEDVEEELRRVTSERDQLREQVGSLLDRLDLVCALADENEAIAVEARQESEASKQHAEQKEQEVKILEHSVEELDCTINVLEKKVYEMEEDVERQKLIRDSLELELQELRQRMLTLENFTESTNVEQHSPDQLLRQLHNRSMELHEAHKRMETLEEGRAEQAKEIKQCKEYISELILLAEAQASQYQQKYKTLEAMARDVKVDSSILTSAAAVLDKGDKSSVRLRGSSSPFRCIATLVHQMNAEKDQEFSMARLRIEELEALVASRQKELCVLNARLAAAESMTHDVIRDLLGVKLDMTNYANLIDQYQLQKLVEAAQQKTQESISMEQEIINQRREINYLTEERERCLSDINRREVDILAVQMTVEQLQERDQLLTARNKMLKNEKSNLKRRIAELDEMVRKLLGTENAQLHIQQHTKTKGNSSVRQGDADLSKRLANSEQILWRVNDELAHYYNYEGGHAHDKMDRHVHRK